MTSIENMSDFIFIFLTADDVLISDAGLGRFGLVGLCDCAASE